MNLKHATHLGHSAHMMIEPATAAAHIEMKPRHLATGHRHYAK